MSPTTIVIDFWNLLLGLVGVLAAFALVCWVFGGILVSQFKAHLESRFTQRDETLHQVEDDLHDLKEDVTLLKVLLPNEYVRREDWIRFSGTLDAKMDRLNEKCELTRHLIATVAARLKVKMGDDDAG